MNARLDKQQDVLRTARRILGFAGLASLLLLCAGQGWAQSQSAQPESTAARAAAVAPATSPAAQSPDAAVAPKQGVAQNFSAKRPAPRGPSEGIQVHGHWTIEVRNPDGKVVSHTEFENALSPGFSFPLPTPTFGTQSVQLPGGSAFLSALMTGQAVMTPENWAILLEGPGGLQGTSAPCTPVDNDEYYSSCFLFPSAADNAFSGPICTTVNASPSPGPNGYSCNLAVSPLGTGPTSRDFSCQAQSSRCNQVRSPLL